MIEEFSKNFKSVTCKPEIIENKDGENETTKYDINYVLFLCQTFEDAQAEMEAHIQTLNGEKEVIQREKADIYLEKASLESQLTASEGIVKAREQDLKRCLLRCEQLETQMQVIKTERNEFE